MDQRSIGFALNVAELGGKHPDSKPLKGFGGAGVLEVDEDQSGGTLLAEIQGGGTMKKVPSHEVGSGTSFGTSSSLTSSSSRAARTPIVILAGALALLAPDRTEGQGVLPCRIPAGDVRALEERLEAAAGTSGYLAVMNAVLRAVLPAQDERCPLLTADQDLDEVLSQLVLFAFAEEQSGELVQGVALGVQGAVDERLANGRTPRKVPLQALDSIIEGSTWEFGRGWALETLLRMSDRPEVFAGLVERARSPVGPPTWPDLPIYMVNHMYVMRSSSLAGLRTALESDVTLIQNYTVRCWVEQGGPESHAPGGDPCRR